MIAFHAHLYHTLHLDQVTMSELETTYMDLDRVSPLLGLL